MARRQIPQGVIPIRIDNVATLNIQDVLSKLNTLQQKFRQFPAATVTVKVNGVQQALRDVTTLQNRLKAMQGTISLTVSLRSQGANLGPNLAQIAASAQQLAAALNQLVALLARFTAAAGQAGAAGGGLGGRLNGANAGMNRFASNLQTLIAALQRKYNALTTVGAALGGFGGQANAILGPLNSVTGAFKGLTASQIALMGPLASVAAILASMSSALGASVNEAAKLELAMDVVQSIARLTSKEMEQLRATFTALSQQLPVSSADLFEIARNVAELGVRGAPQIAQFTETVAKLGVASQTTAGQMGDLAHLASEIAIFLNETGETPKTYQQALDGVVNALAAVSAEGASTIPMILNLSRYMAAGAKSFNLSQADIIGLSGALSALGSRAEAGGSAVNRVLAKMNRAVSDSGKQLDAYARVSGVTAESFSNLVRNNPAQAFITLAGGIKKAHEEGTDMTTILDALGLRNVRDIRLLDQMFIGYEQLARSVRVANEALENKRILDERVAIATDNFKSRVAELKNTFTAAGQAIGMAFLPLIDEFLKLLQDNPKLIGQVAASLVFFAQTLIGVGQVAAGVGVQLLAPFLALGKTVTTTYEELKKFISDTLKDLGTAVERIKAGDLQGAGEAVARSLQRGFENVNLGQKVGQRFQDDLSGFLSVGNVLREAGNQRIFDFAPGSENFNKTVQQVTGNVDLLKQKLDADAKAAETAKTAHNALADALGEEVGQYDTLIDKLDNLQAGFKKAGLTDFQRDVARGKEALSDFRREVERIYGDGGISKKERADLLSRASDLAPKLTDSALKEQLEKDKKTILGFEEELAQARTAVIRDARAQRVAEFETELKALQNTYGEQIKTLLSNAKTPGLNPTQRREFQNGAGELQVKQAEAERLLREQLNQDLEELDAERVKQARSAAQAALAAQAETSSARVRLIEGQMEEELALVGSNEAERLKLIERYAPLVEKARVAELSDRRTAAKAALDNELQDALDAAKDAGTKRGELEMRARETYLVKLRNLDLGFEADTNALRLQQQQEYWEAAAALSKKALDKELKNLQDLTGAELASLRTRLNNRLALTKNPVEQADIRDRIKQVEGQQADNLRDFRDALRSAEQDAKNLRNRLGEIAETPFAKALKDATAPFDEIIDAADKRLSDLQKKLNGVGARNLTPAQRQILQSDQSELRGIRNDAATQRELAAAKARLDFARQEAKEERGFSRERLNTALESARSDAERQAIRAEILNLNRQDIAAIDREIASLETQIGKEKEVRNLRRERLGLQAQIDAAPREELERANALLDSEQKLRAAQAAYLDAVAKTDEEVGAMKVRNLRNLALEIQGIDDQIAKQKELGLSQIDVNDLLARRLQLEAAIQQQAVDLARRPLDLEEKRNEVLESQEQTRLQLNGLADDDLEVARLQLRATQEDIRLLDARLALEGEGALNAEERYQAQVEYNRLLVQEDQARRAIQEAELQGAARIRETFDLEQRLAALRAGRDDAVTTAQLALENTRRELAAQQELVNNGEALGRTARQRQGDQKRLVELQLDEVTAVKAVTKAQEEAAAAKRAEVAAARELVEATEAYGRALGGRDDAVSTAAAELNNIRRLMSQNSADQADQNLTESERNKLVLERANLMTREIEASRKLFDANRDRLKAEQALTAERRKNALNASADRDNPVKQAENDLRDVRERLRLAQEDFRLAGTDTRREEAEKRIVALTGEETAAVQKLATAYADTAQRSLDLLTARVRAAAQISGFADDAVLSAQLDYDLARNQVQALQARLDASRQLGLTLREQEDIQNQITTALGNQYDAERKLRDATQARIDLLQGLRDSLSQLSDAGAQQNPDGTTRLNRIVTDADVKRMDSLRKLSAAQQDFERDPSTRNTERYRDAMNSATSAISAQREALRNLSAAYRQQIQDQDAVRESTERLRDLIKPGKEGEAGKITDPGLEFQKLQAIRARRDQALADLNQALDAGEVQAIQEAQAKLLAAEERNRKQTERLEKAGLQVTADLDPRKLNATLDRLEQFNLASERNAPALDKQAQAADLQAKAADQQVLAATKAGESAAKLLEGLPTQAEVMYDRIKLALVEGAQELRLALQSFKPPEIKVETAKPTTPQAPALYNGVPTSYAPVITPQAITAAVQAAIPAVFEGVKASGSAVASAARPINYSPTLNVTVNTPPGQNVDVDALADRVMDKLERDARDFGCNDR